MPYDNSHQIASGQIRRSTSDKGAPYWGKLRITPEQLAALIAWADRNEMQQNQYGNGQEAYYELGIAAWPKQDRNGGEFFSFVVEQPYKSNRVSTHEAAGTVPQAKPAAAPAPAARYATDDVPF